MILNVTNYWKNEGRKSVPNWEQHERVNSEYWVIIGIKMAIYSYIINWKS